ncbi:MAG TPA: flagellar hook-basal body complex protein FliE, partial [Solimonas sp.]|nr:flagellar hook-basal body complex protein FliE [Solimonas sp.]
RVNEAQQDSARLQNAFAIGDKNTDLASVMVAGARAQVQFKGMVEVRNRLVSAYQDIMNMPI